MNNNNGTNIFICIGMVAGALLLVNALKVVFPIATVGGVVYAVYRYIARPQL